MYFETFIRTAVRASDSCSVVPHRRASVTFCYDGTRPLRAKNSNANVDVLSLLVRRRNGWPFTATTGATSPPNPFVAPPLCLQSVSEQLRSTDGDRSRRPPYLLIYRVVTVVRRVRAHYGHVLRRSHPSVSDDIWAFREPQQPFTVAVSSYTALIAVTKPDRVSHLQGWVLVRQFADARSCARLSRTSRVTSTVALPPVSDVVTGRRSEYLRGVRETLTACSDFEWVEFFRCFCRSVTVGTSCLVPVGVYYHRRLWILPSVYNRWCCASWQPSVVLSFCSRSMFLHPIPSLDSIGPSTTNRLYPWRGEEVFCCPPLLGPKRATCGLDPPVWWDTPLY